MTVGNLPIINVVPPDDLVGIYMHSDSGKLDPSMLVSVGPSGLLHHDAARAYNALAFLCMGFNLPLTYTYGGCYRDYANQVALFLQRYSTTPIAGRPTKNWNGKTYWQKPNTAMAAVPGTSNHGWGIAVDAAYDSDPSNGIGPNNAAGITGHPQWTQFKDAALACGFSWETTSEPWHIRLVTGSNPTQQVLDAEALISGGVPVPDPIPAPIPGEFGDYPTTSKATIRLGAQGALVSYLQSVLKIKLGYAIGVDGNWGPVTNQFVIWFQATHSLLGDGVVGPKTWAVIDALAVA